MSVQVIIQQLKRKFKIGALELPDPIPFGSLDEVQASLAAQFPMLRHTRIFESDATPSPCGEFLVYEFILPPVKTQG